MATIDSDVQIMAAQWGLSPEKKRMLVFLMEGVQIDPEDAYVFCEKYAWNAEQIGEHMFDPAYLDEWTRKKEQRAAEQERTGKFGDDALAILPVKPQTLEPKREILVQCKCGAEMIVTTPRESYPDFNNVARCDYCATLISGDDFIYYCSKGRSADHKHGYDLCITCAHRKFPKAAKQPLRPQNSELDKPPRLRPAVSQLEVPQLAVKNALNKHRIRLLDLMHKSRKMGGNITFVIGKEKTEFSVHKMFLIASSPYWKEKLAKSTKGKTIVLEHVSPNAFQCVLNFAYGNHPKVTPATVVETRYLAELYKMKALADACDNYMDASIDDGLCDVLTGIFALEEQLLSPDAKVKDVDKKSLKGGLDYCRERVDEAVKMQMPTDAKHLLKSGGFLRMRVDSMGCLISNDDFCVTEDELWDALLMWAQYQAQAGRVKSAQTEEDMKESEDMSHELHYLKQIKKHVRFPLMTAKHFVEAVVPVKILNDDEVKDVNTYHKDPKQGCTAFVTKPRRK